MCEQGLSLPGQQQCQTQGVGLPRRKEFWKPPAVSHLGFSCCDTPWGQSVPTSLTLRHQHCRCPGFPVLAHTGFWKHTERSMV